MISINKLGQIATSPDWMQRLSVHLEEITPEIASKMLERNKANYRNLIQGNKNKITQDMLNGRWSFTNATIALDENEDIVDGQHRLFGIVESGTSQIFLVVRGMPVGSKDNPAIDTGAKRSVATHLHKLGTNNANVAAAAARLLLRIKAGVTAAKTGSFQSSDSEVAAVVMSNPSIVEAAAVGLTTKRLITPSVLATWFWLVSHDDKALAEKCVRILEGNEEALSSHPFMRCKDTILELRGDKKRGQVTPDFQLRLLLSAWDKVRKGETCKLLRPFTTVRISDAADQALQRIGV